MVKRKGAVLALSVSISLTPKAAKFCLISTYKEMHAAHYRQYLRYVPTKRYHCDLIY